MLNVVAQSKDGNPADLEVALEAVDIPRQCPHDQWVAPVALARRLAQVDLAVGSVEALEVGADFVAGLEGTVAVLAAEVVSVIKADEAGLVALTGSEVVSRRLTHPLAREEVEATDLVVDLMTVAEDTMIDHTGVVALGTIVVSQVATANR